MKDRLEEFVRKNREAFDVHEPDPGLWLKIAPEQKKRGRVRHLTWLRYAAAIAIIFAGFSSGIYFLTRQGTGNQDAYSEMYRELVESETYYNALAKEKYKELEPYLTSSPEIRDELNTDLEELDDIYLELRKDLKDDVDNPEVIEAMIQNYRTKVMILENLLEILKEKDNKHDGNNEKISL